MIRSLLFALCIGLSAAVLANEPPASLKLSQTRVALPKLIAYLDVRDAGGKPLSELKAGQFSASLAELKLPVEQLQPFEKTHEGLATIFLVDVSLSLKPEQFAKIRAALSAWADESGASDRMAILSFGDTVTLVSDFTANSGKLKQAIGALKPTDKHTALHQGLIQAMQLGQKVDAGLSGRRVIVVLSDGLDDLSGSATADEVLKQMETDRVPIYAIGWEKQKHSSKQEAGIKALGLFARSSGGDYVSVANQNLEDVYARLRERIKAVTTLQLDCSNCKTDGSSQRLQITLQDAGLVLTDGEDMRLLPPLSASQPPPASDEINWQQPWVYGGVAAAIIMLLVGVWPARRRKLAAVELTEPDKEDDYSYSPNILVMSATVPKTKPAPELPFTRVKLVVLGGKGRSKTYDLKVSGESVIGRGVDCAVSIAGDTEISTRHCTLIRKARAIVLQDLGSTNGTLVNGVPIASEYRLQEGDIIGIGRTELRVLILGAGQ